MPSSRRFRAPSPLFGVGTGTTPSADVSARAAPRDAHTCAPRSCSPPGHCAPPSSRNDVTSFGIPSHPSIESRPWRFQVHRDGQALAARPRSANRGQRSSGGSGRGKGIGQCPRDALSHPMYERGATQVLGLQVPPVSAFPQVRHFQSYATRAVHGWKSRCNPRCNRPGHTTASVVEVGTSVARGFLCVLWAPEGRVRAVEPVADLSIASWGVPTPENHPSNQPRCLREEEEHLALVSLAANGSWSLTMAESTSQT